MTRVIAGSDRRALRLRRDFERSLAVVVPALAGRYGAGLAERLTNDAREVLARLAPRVPWVRGPRGVVFNAFLAITAQELAAFHAFRQHGHPPDETWAWCHRWLARGPLAAPVPLGRFAASFPDRR